MPKSDWMLMTCSSPFARRVWIEINSKMYVKELKVVTLREKGVD